MLDRSVLEAQGNHRVDAPRVPDWVAGWGLAVLLATLIAYAVTTGIWLLAYSRQVDLMIYRYAGQSVLHHTPLYDYGLSGKSGELLFTYPPFGAILFTPLALFPCHPAQGGRPDRQRRLARPHRAPVLASDGDPDRKRVAALDDVGRRSAALAHAGPHDDRARANRSGTARRVGVRPATAPSWSRPRSCTGLELPFLCRDRIEALGAGEQLVSGAPHLQISAEDAPLEEVPDTSVMQASNLEDLYRTEGLSSGVRSSRSPRTRRSPTTRWSRLHRALISGFG
jgi:hypothetical protein